MAHVIKITAEMIEEVKSAFFDALPTMRLSEGKIDFRRNLAEIDRKAVLRFTERAWLKMSVLVNGYDSEIGWHGLAHRSEGEPDTFVVDDIIIYPQKVTATTVTPDQVAYQNWLMEQPDEIFNNIRFQGHSHVNMGVTPSGVDTAFYDEILGQLDDSMFYIFMVINKRFETHVRIYDMLNNIFYGTKDVTIEIMNEVGVDEILAEAKKKVVREVYKPPVAAAAAPSKNVPAATQAAKPYTGSTGSYSGKQDKGKSADKDKRGPFGKEYRSPTWDGYDPDNYWAFN